MRQRISRTDANHSALAKVVRQLDPDALDVHSFGPIGCDYLARHIRTGETRFLEFKDPTKPPSARALTENELAMQARFRPFYFVCQCTYDVVRALTK